MFTRPSVAQITSAYTGKVPALEARVKQEKQTNNGLSPDLRKLLALQDLTSDTEHMGINQALQSPSKPPTINQSYQDRAKQIIQAKMAKAQQDANVARKQQEGMIAKASPGPVPEGIAQPRRQPEGIDQLPSNVGASYARGGIIAFGGQDSSFVRDVKALKDKFVGAFGETPEEKEAREKRVELMKKNSPTGYFTKSSDQYSADRAVAEFVAANPGIVNSPVFKADPAAYVKGVMEQKTQKPAKAPTQEENLDETLRLMQRAPASSAPQQGVNEQAPAANKPAANKPPAPAANAGAPAAPAQPNAAKPNAQSGIATLPAAMPELPAPAAGSPRDIMGKDMARDPDKESLRILEARERLLGAPDTSQYDALVNELKGQKEKLLQKKAPGWDAFIEYMGDISASPTAGSSAKAGALGAERRRQRELGNQQKANALSERMIDIAQKKLDTQYNYKKEGFALSEGERKAVFEARFNAAKAAGESDDRARKMAQDAVLEANRNAATIRAAGISAGARQGQLMDIAQALMAKDSKLDLEKALTKAANLIGTTAQTGNEIKNLAEFNKAKAKLDDSPIALIMTADNPKGRLAKQQYETQLRQLYETHGITGGAGLNSLPTNTTIPAGVTVTQTSSK